MKSIRHDSPWFGAEHLKEPGTAAELRALENVVEWCRGYVTELMNDVAHRRIRHPEFRERAVQLAEGHAEYVSFRDALRRARESSVPRYE